MDWREITGEEPPPTPVSARTYSEHGFPWFSLYVEGVRAEHRRKRSLLPLLDRMALASAA